jgi:hypothetical protein
MGLKISSLNALTYGDMLDNRYDIYKINELSKIEYFKVEDLLDFDVKYLQISTNISIHYKNIQCGFLKKMYRTSRRE